MLQCVTSDGLRDAPYPVKLLEELELARCAYVTGHAAGEGAERELFSGVYDADTACVELGHLGG